MIFSIRSGFPYRFAFIGLLLLMAQGTSMQVFASDTQENRAGTPRSRYAASDGMRIHYLDTGKGAEALVFIHGWTCNVEFWRGQIPHFAARTRVIAVDLPGHGLSDRPERIEYSMDTFARAVEAVMTDAGVKRAVLVGHSMGTQVARQFYRRSPARTLAVVIVDGTLLPFASTEEMEKFVAPLRGPNYAETAAKFIDGMLLSTQTEALRQEIKTAMLSTPQHVAVGAWDGMIDEDIWVEDQIKVPVLAVLARSPFWPADNEQRFRRIAPTLDYEMMEGVSHFLMMDEPEKFNQSLSSFLARRKLLRQK